MYSRLDGLRSLMREHGIDVYFIPTDDFHGSEFVSDYFKEREWVSGFTGSAGSLVVTQDHAGLFTDGRYFLQAEEELKGSPITLYKSGMEGVPSLSEFLFQCLEDDGCFGFDGRCVTASFIKKLQEYFETRNKKFRMKAEKDLVGRLWKDRPALPSSKPFVLEEKYCGEIIGKKLQRVRETMVKQKAGSLLLTSLDDIAWLLNIRGDDIRYSPLVLSYLFITETEVYFYCGDTGTVPGDEQLICLLNYLKEHQIQRKGYFEIYQDMKKGRLLKKKGTVPVMLDPEKVNFRLYELLEKQKIPVVERMNPTTRMKAVKNETEIANERLAHRKDAVSFIRFLYWLKNECEISHVTELELAQRLLSERKKMKGFISESFESIVAYGKHGAIVHYSATEKTNACLQEKSFVLMDTGAHYLEGTTDITRTISCGELTAEEKRHFTLVLKGNLALGHAVFLEGITGAGLDLLARAPLWKEGLDYRHGTGHGVGYLLNVHEGPNNIRYPSGKSRNSGAVLKAGMITSNEPGLYMENKYGIRHENLTVCRELFQNEYGRFLTFETLTLVPFDLSAIDASLLTNQEKQWLNEYHQTIYDTLSEELSVKEREFLWDITRPVH